MLRGDYNFILNAWPRICMNFVALGGFYFFARLRTLRRLYAFLSAFYLVTVSNISMNLLKEIVITGHCDLHVPGLATDWTSSGSVLLLDQSIKECQATTCFPSFASTVYRSSHRPDINLTSVQRRPEIDPTSASHRPHIAPKKTLIGPSSAWYRPHIDLTCVQHQKWWSPLAWDLVTTRLV